MANASSKKIAAANAKTLVNLRNGFLIVNVIYFLWRIVYHWNSFTFSQFFLYSTTAGLTYLFYRLLVSSGTPKYAADGSLLNSGEDLNSEGLTAYMFDIIYVTWFVHIATAFFSNKFWLVYLVIPAYAVYKLGPMAMSYLGKGSAANDQQTEGSADGKSKRQAKLEKRANKGQGQVKYAR